MVHAETAVATIGILLHSNSSFTATRADTAYDTSESLCTGDLFTFNFIICTVHFTICSFAVAPNQRTLPGMADSGNVNPFVSYLCPPFGCCQEVTGLVAVVAQNWKLQSFLVVFADLSATSLSKPDILGPFPGV